MRACQLCPPLTISNVQHLVITIHFGVHLCFLGAESNRRKCQDSCSRPYMPRDPFLCLVGRRTQPKTTKESAGANWEEQRLFPGVLLQLTKAARGSRAVSSLGPRWLGQLQHSVKRPFSALALCWLFVCQLDISGKRELQLRKLLHSAGP